MIDDKLRSEIRRWAEVVASKDIDERDHAMRFDRDIWHEAGQLRLPGMMVPQNYGGMGLEANGVIEVMEIIGKYSLDGGFNFGLGAHNLACVSPIVKYGSAEQKKKHLPKLSDGSWIAANAMTEASSGSDAFDLSFVATKLDNGDFKLHGEKTYVTNGPEADIIVCYAKTDSSKGGLGGVTAFLLEKEKEHFVPGPNERKMGLKTCTMNKILCDGVVVNKEQILGRVGFGASVFHYSMLWERACMPALYTGSIDRLLTSCIAFVTERQAFGQSISKFQAISHKLAEISTKLTVSRELLQACSKVVPDGSKSTIMASKTKWYISEFYKQAMIDFHQIFAGAAFRGNNDVERSLRASVASTLYSGTSEVHKSIIAQSLGLK